MTKKTVFLTAKWKHLILITYKVPEEILASYLPAGIEPDRWEGKCFASLVAFDFIDTKVKGIKIPSHINFPEINLRFYVREKSTGRRGVVFIRELVPKVMISFVARTIYNEPYLSVPMESKIEIGDEIKVRHKIKFEGEKYHIDLKAENKPFMPGKDSVEHFFKEHSWGFGKSKSGKTLIYEVEHPEWNIFPVKNVEHNFDFNKIYGNEWDFLNDSKPHNVTFAEGSEVTVYGHSDL